VQDVTVAAEESTLRVTVRYLIRRTQAAQEATFERGGGA
jgi:hypothetical protein